MSESIETLSNEELYSMIAKGIVEHAKTSDELTAVKAELAELRKERDELCEAICNIPATTKEAMARFHEILCELQETQSENDELRKAVLGLGEVRWSGWDYTVGSSIGHAKAWNALVAKLRAEKETEP